MKLRILILTEKVVPPAYTPRVRTLVNYLTSQGHVCDWIDDGKVAHLNIASYDWIFCSSYYYFPVQLAGRLARKYHKPLLIDLRDIAEQWGKEGFHKRHLPWKWLDRPVQKIVQDWRIMWRNQVLRQAAVVTTISPWHSDFLHKINPNTHLIYNGFDPLEIQPQDKPTDIFRITYTGQLHDLRLRNPEQLFRAVSELNVPIQLDFYIGEDQQTALEQLAKQYRVNITCYDYVPREQLQEVLHEASILLILTLRSTPTGAHGLMTTKFYEALGCEKPVLCIPSDGECLADAIRQTNAGLASDNVDEIKQFVMEKYSEWQQHGYTHQKVHQQEQFSRRYQAQQFEQLLCQK